MPIGLPKRLPDPVFGRRRIRMRNALRKLTVFDIVNLMILSSACLVVIIPFMYIISISLTPMSVLHELGNFTIFPREVSWEAYKLALSMPQFTRSFMVSMYLVVVGTTLNLFFTVLLAYPLSKFYLRGRSAVLLMVVFTMIFNGGMIPTYLVVKSLGMINTLWALMIPTVISAFNMLIIKQFFENLPKEIEESAIIDGANDFQVMWKIYIPLSMPVFAAIGLFYAVFHWNELFQGILYLNDQRKWPLQVVLYFLLQSATQITNSEYGETSLIGEMEHHPESLRMALVILATLPMVIIYPFVQKHFVKGMLTGSIKG